MAVVTIHNLDELLERRLHARAAEHGRSMEEEAREILRAALCDERMEKLDLGSAMHALFKPLGGVDLELPPREPIRDPPTFD